MHCGAAPLLQEAEPRLDIVMMHSSPGDAQPLAFAGFHQVERDVRVLKLFARLHGLQIRPAKNEAVRAQRVAERALGQSPPFHFAVARDEER